MLKTKIQKTKNSDELRLLLSISSVVRDFHEGFSEVILTL